MMDLTDENMKCLALGAVVVFAIYIVYKYQGYNQKIREGFGHSSSDPNNFYKTSLQKIPSDIKSTKNILNVKNSRDDIEDILVDLSELIQLGKMNTLLQYSNGKMEAADTNNVGEHLRSMREINTAIHSSIKYLDTMKN
jgi:hypothetical protein